MGPTESQSCSQPVRWVCEEDVACGGEDEVVGGVEVGEAVVVDDGGCRLGGRGW